MICIKCGKDLRECTCPDIDERMKGLEESDYLVFRMDKNCGKHYKRCDCDNPEWIRSDTKEPMVVPQGAYWEK